MAGATSVAISGGGACGCAQCGCYGVRQRERRGGGEAEAHNGHGELGSGVGDELERAGRRRGSPAMAVWEELGEGSAERASARGWVFSMKQTTAELWDMMVR